MGKTDKAQAKLHFESSENPKPRGGHTDEVGVASEGLESDTEPELKHILTKMQQSLATIDCKIDSLSFRMDRMSEGLDKQAERINAAEHRISMVEGYHNTVALAQSKMDKTVAVLQARVKDLEARSHRSNI
ncbi:hypothetical protein NDU88_006006 [Pleurodeles waltl]|uniref:Uncharacterized protein n=1 Tax=Pleurodeles waltl TaxID=8319 RepID=A0AAV7RQY0_PLEWA|nr:hypothetical protein NDU88_006006 [Pleurodeles waltl]